MNRTAKEHFILSTGLAVSLIAIGYVSACALTGLPKPQSPAQAVFEAQAGLLGAIQIANQYKALPPCGPTVSRVCSDATIVATLQKSANATAAIIDAADMTVNDPNFRNGPAAVQASIAASNALGALTAITVTLKLR